MSLFIDGLFSSQVIKYWSPIIWSASACMQPPIRRVNVFFANYEPYLIEFPLDIDILSACKRYRLKPGVLQLLANSGSLYSYLQRIPIQGKFGQGENGYRLNCIRAKRADTSVAWINSIFLVMNLLILLRVFSVRCKTGLVLPSLAFAWKKSAFLCGQSKADRCSPPLQNAGSLT
ncbi:MAG: hypothetical protein WCH04_22690 [Gammaproteobacteria bacterium]